MILISDEELVRRIKYGDKEALDGLIRRYHKPLHAYIIRMGIESHLAGDIVQEIFIKLLGGIKMYEETRPFRPWIYTIACNAYKDYLKKAYVQRDVVMADLESKEIGEGDPEEILLQREKRVCVAAALQGLSKIHREVVVLRYYQELKLEEMASILEIPTGTVKSRLYNALQQLKKCLQKGAPENGNKVG